MYSSQCTRKHPINRVLCTITPWSSVWRLPSLIPQVVWEIPLSRSVQASVTFIFDTSLMATAHVKHTREHCGCQAHNGHGDFQWLFHRHANPRQTNANWLIFCTPLGHTSLGIATRKHHICVCVHMHNIAKKPTLYQTKRYIFKWLRCIEFHWNWLSNIKAVYFVIAGTELTASQIY